MYGVHFNQEEEEFDLRKAGVSSKKTSKLVTLTMSLIRTKDETLASRLLMSMSICIFIISAVIFIHAQFAWNDDPTALKNPNNTILTKDKTTNE